MDDLVAGCTSHAKRRNATQRNAMLLSPDEYVGVV